MIIVCGNIFLTYILNLPGILSGKQKSVDEYYRKNFLTNVPLDLFFILMYFLVSKVMRLLNIKKHNGQLFTAGNSITHGFFATILHQNP